MDKKNTILGIICIAAGIGFMYKQTNDLKDQQVQQQLQEAAALDQARIEASVADAVVTDPAALAGEDILGLLTQSLEAPAQSSFCKPRPANATIIFSMQMVVCPH